MAVKIDTTQRRNEFVTSIEIHIGDEYTKHHFGRRVPMSQARALAQHFLDIHTGHPSDLVVNQKEDRV